MAEHATSGAPGRTVRAHGRYAVWGVGDQVLNALSNAALTFLAAHHLSAQGFGRFALLLTALIIALGAIRALTTEPYTVLTSDQDAAAQRDWAGPALGATITLGTLVALTVAVVGLATGAGDVLAFALAAVPVIGQDGVRYLLIAQRRVRAAFVNDLTWLVVQAVATIVVAVLGRLDAVSLVACWALGAAVALVLGMVQLRVRPAVLRTTQWLARTRGYSTYYLLEFAALAGSGYSIVYLVAAIGGLADAGAYRGAQALYGPVTSLIGGLRMVALPAVVRMRPRGRSAVVRAALTVGLALGVLSVVVMGGLWLLRDWFGPLLLGATAAAALPLIVPMGLGRAASSASAGPLLGLRALGATRASLATRAAMSALTVLLAAVGAVLGGAVGAAWGFALASAVAAVAWFAMLARQPMATASLGPSTATGGTA